MWVFCSCICKKIRQNVVIISLGLNYWCFCLQWMLLRSLMPRLRHWKQPRLWNPAQPHLRRSRRSEPLSRFTGQGHWPRTEILNIPVSAQPQGTSLISTRFLSTRWPLNLQWRRLKTITLWFSLLTSAPTRRRLRMLSRRCMTFRPRRLTHWSGKLFMYLFGSLFLEFMCSAVKNCLFEGVSHICYYL